LGVLVVFIATVWVWREMEGLDRVVYFNGQILHFGKWNFGGIFS
jgi:hypothetical protein